MAISQELMAQLAANLSQEDIQALVAAHGNTQQNNPSIPVPQQPVAIPTSEQCQMGKHPAGMGATSSLIDSFRACGKAINGGVDVDHSY